MHARYNDWVSHTSRQYPEAAMLEKARYRKRMARKKRAAKAKGRKNKRMREAKED